MSDKSLSAEECLVRNAQARARRANQSPEEREKRLESGRDRWANQSPEEREKRRESGRDRYASLSPEEHQAYRAKKLAAYHTKHALLPKKPYVKRTGKPSKANEAKVSFEYVRATYEHLPDGRFVRKIKQWRFEIGTEVGGLTKQGYRHVFIGGILYKVARLIYLWHTGAFPPDGYDVGHLNLNKSDNRWENLALQTRSQNSASRGNYGKYPYGVSKEGNSFRAYCILPNGKKLRLRNFPYNDFESLGHAYTEAEWSARGGEIEAKGADYVPATRSKLVPNILGGRALMLGAIKVEEWRAKEAGIPVPTKDEKDEGAWDAGWCADVDSVWDAVASKEPWPPEEDQNMSKNFGSVMTSNNSPSDEERLAENAQELDRYANRTLEERQALITRSLAALAAQRALLPEENETVSDDSGKDA